jgi:hypothetical protein
MARPTLEEIRRDNAAYFETIMDDPHPLRALKTHVRSIGAPVKEAKEGYEKMLSRMRVMRNNDSFLNFRRMSVGLMALDKSANVTGMDLLFILCDEPKIFVMEKDIGTLLLETDLKGSDFEDLKLPFRTIYIQLPANPYKVWIKGEVGNLEGVYVTQDTGDPGVSWTIVILVGRKEEMLDPCDDCLFSLPILLEAGPLDSQVEARITDLKKRKYEPEEVDNLTQFGDVFKWILNCILYINSEGADLKRGWFHEKAAQTMKAAKGNKKRNIRHALEETSTEVTWVGRSVKIEKAHVEGEPRGPLDGERDSPRLHWVRGFYRMQVHGAGRALRKKTWVKPFLRGEGREILEKVYKVE